MLLQKERLPRFESRHTKLLVREFSLRVLIASTSKLAVPTIEALRGAGHEILGVLTKEDRPSGRGQNKKSQLIVEEIDTNIPIFKISDQNVLATALRDTKPDLVVAISFGMLVKPESLAIPKNGWINLHFSLLPKYRGAAPVQRAILAGESESGVTVFALDEGMDTGPIYASRKISIAGMNTGEALDEMSSIGASVVIDAIDAISAGISPVAQIGDFSLARKIESDETRIDFGLPAVQIERQIRAFSPKPGAWCFLRGLRMKILAADAVANSKKSPGEILATNPLTVATIDGALLIKTIQESGKKAMNSGEWVRGARIELSEKFE